VAVPSPSREPMHRIALDHIGGALLPRLCENKIALLHPYPEPTVCLDKEWTVRSGFACEVPNRCQCVGVGIAPQRASRGLFAGITEEPKQVGCWSMSDTMTASIHRTV